ncbi:MAG: redoxin domain-containing protein [Gemmatimonadetes bacterium]|nr:redoxin domain-containing protein [Gemmatimonadota bacterium]
MPLQLGSTAPDVTLYLRPKEPVSLRELHAEQPLVLLFFPLAFSSVCTGEMCSVAEDYAAYRELGAQVAGISVDSPYVNQKFAESCNASFPILSDFNKEATRRFGVWRDELNGLQGVANRAAFVLDTSGRVVYAWMSENPGDLPPFQEIKGAVRRAAGG